MIERKFGKMTKIRGDKHTIVGMNIDFTDDGRVKILMKDCLEESIVSSNDDLGPVNNHPS